MGEQRISCTLAIKYKFLFQPATISRFQSWEGRAAIQSGEQSHHKFRLGEQQPTWPIITKAASISSITTTVALQNRLGVQLPTCHIISNNAYQEWMLSESSQALCDIPSHSASNKTHLPADHVTVKSKRFETKGLGMHPNTRVLFHNRTSEMTALYRHAFGWTEIDRLTKTNQPVLSLSNIYTT